MEILQILLIIITLLFGGSSPAVVQQPPDGTYVTIITRAELTAQHMPDSLACENAGTFTLVITGNRWSSSQTAAPGCNVESPVDSGSWQFNGQQVTFHEDRPLGCTTSYT